MRLHFIQPVRTFCCGCTLDFGIKIIIAVHSLVCIFFFVTTLSNIVFDSPTLGHTVSLGTQTFNCFLSLASIPFILSGISGVKHHIEIHLRIYLYWLIFVLALDLVFLVIFLVKTTCVKMPAVLAQSGGSFACGAMRIIGILNLLIAVGFMTYAIFVVWSRCEEMQLMGSEPAFTSLLYDQRLMEQKYLSEHRMGLFGTGVAAHEAHPIAACSMASEVHHGSVPIFGGSVHQMAPSPFVDRYK